MYIRQNGKSVEEVEGPKAIYESDRRKQKPEEHVDRAYRKEGAM